MVLLPIVLGVRQSPDAENTGSSASKSLVEKVLRRDNFCCRFCGFQSKQFQRIVPCPAAGDPPFATACTFCDQCVILERAGLTGAGLLIWLPEISQVELNHLARAIYVARAMGKNSDTAELATRALDTLTARRAETKKRLGSDDPMLLATIMHENLSLEEQQAAAVKLDGVRVLPSEKHIVRGTKGDVNHFPQMIKYWCSPDGPYANFPVKQWPDLFKNAVEKVGNA